MNTGVFLCLLTVGLAVLLARENKLRRGLQVLCGRLLSRLADFQNNRARPNPGFDDQSDFHSQAHHHRHQDPPPHHSKHLPATSTTRSPAKNTTSTPSTPRSRP